MSGAPGPARRGRRGRRTTRMIQIAQERIADLFALAQTESLRPDPALADRYVRLARRIGTRYNVRLLREYRELYCRGCSAYWVEGRSVRTRLRGGHRVRTCQRCGRQRRFLLRPGVARPTPTGEFLPQEEIAGRVAVGSDEDETDEGEEE